MSRIQLNTQNRVGQAQAQLPDAVKKEGVTVKKVKSGHPDGGVAVVAEGRRTTRICFSTTTAT
jgi:multidrug efflux pump subunit AcrB